MELVHIQTASKKYPLFLGTDSTGVLDKLISHFTPAVSSVLIISDSIIAPLYMQEVKRSITCDNVFEFIIPSGEKEKSFENYYAAQTFALQCGLDRHSLIVALGGGVIGDLAGFVAATYMRGIRFIQIPTTLLAHDSAVGGKVAINHPLGKNMIGAFYQPEAVIYNVSFLDSLPLEEWRSGFAEVIKHALIWDASFYEWLRTEIRTLEDLRGENLIYALRKAIAVKASVVSKDETEQGIRAYLNFGHTLGHAIEAELGYGTITHGDAVAIGMLFAVFVSEYTYQKDLGFRELASWFRSYGFSTFPAHLKAEDLLIKMKQDKKANSGTIRMVLLKEIGHVEVQAVEDAIVLSLLEKFSKGEGLA
ncbi:3-dehydroquinate synthase [Bacillus sp. 165]|uniref:3-dehydroquinate synthase n=1 Tax=Bacillus sp. 165 TaxID=1529117 RepID=UPI001ADB9109|nr:3-dehydroquinate synthase [Bacillus sp. 165]MBO9128241.1 3-dehydroquinate synthase [Bacillus sp. 165]